MKFINHKQKNNFIADLFFKKSRTGQSKEGFPHCRNNFKLTSQKPMIKKAPRFFFNKRGQGLIEYLILIALMGVATIGIIRTLNQTVKSRFANAIYALQGRNQKAKTHNMKKGEYQRSDLSNFMSGSSSTDKKKIIRKR